VNGAANQASGTKRGRALRLCPVCDQRLAPSAGSRAVYCSDACQVLGTGTDPRHVEGLRSKLKKLVARNLLTEQSSRCHAQQTTSPTCPYTAIRSRIPMSARHPRDIAMASRGVDVLSRRIVVRPADLVRRHRFCRAVLGLAI
jgi:hypothetical protein